MAEVITASTMLSSWLLWKKRPRVLPKDLKRRPSVRKAGILGGCEFYFKYHPNYSGRQMKPEYKKSEIGVKERVKSEYSVANDSNL